MNLYVFEQLDQVSGNYHTEGGLIVIAEDEQQARALANAKENVEVLDHHRPSYCAEVLTTEPRVFVFPDAGCC